MTNSLSIINAELLSEEEKTAVDKEINQLISRHKNNRYEINRLVFESVAALTDSENYREELHSQGLVKRFWGGITGKNQELRDRAASSLARSQYASQQTLQKLAEQNVMSFELITAVNNKLNASLIEVESEINKIYATLTVFFKRTKSDIIQLESRVERLERNVNLLNWQSSIEFQMWDGIEYSELGTIDKIVCLVRDFYELTKGTWTTSDLLLLKSAMSEIGLSPKDLISYRYFIEGICDNERSFEKLFGMEDITGVENIPEYVALTAGIRKNRGLVSDELYVLDNTCKVLDSFQCDYKKEEVRYRLLAEYEKEQAKINIDTSVNMYDFMLELLYNLQQIKEMKKVNSFADKLKEAELFFGIWDIEHAYPILKELAEYGVSRAKYMLAIIAAFNFNYCENDPNRWKTLLEECMEEEPLARARYFIPGRSDTGKVMDKEEFISMVNSLKKQAEAGDRLAAWEYGRLALNFTNWGIGETDYQEASRMFNKTYPVLGKFNVARRYDNGQGVERDYKQAFQYYLESANYGYGQAEYEVGRDYANGRGCEKDEKKAFEYYKRAEEHGYWDAINSVGNCYINGIGIAEDDKAAFDYFMKGAELNLVNPTSNVGYCYAYGKGVNQDYTQARKYYKKAASMGGDDGYAHTNLALLYIQGKGGDVDKNEAKKLLEEAAAMGYERAKEELKKNFGV